MTTPKKRGRPQTPDRARVIRLWDLGRTPVEIYKELGVSESVVRRIIQAERDRRRERREMYNDIGNGRD